MYNKFKLTTLALGFLLSSSAYSSTWSEIFSSRAGSKISLQNEGKDLKKFAKADQCPKLYPWGAPQVKDEEVNKRSLYICRTTFAIQYDPLIKVPLWTIEKLSKTNFDIPNYKHEYSIQPDFDLPSTMQPYAEEYLSGIYYPGQLISTRNIIINDLSMPLEDLKQINLQAIKESLYFTNTAPMPKTHLNGGIWSDLEDFVIDMAKKNNQLYVITGSIYINGNSSGQLPKSKSYIPTHYYKIITNPDTHGSVSYIIPNKEVYTEKTKTFLNSNNVFSCNGGPCTLSNFVVPMGEVEKLTNSVFFPKLAPAWATQIKLNVGEMYKESKEKEERRKKIEKTFEQGK